MNLKSDILSLLVQYKVTGDEGDNKLLVSFPCGIQIWKFNI